MGRGDAKGRSRLSWTPRSAMSRQSSESYRWQAYSTNSSRPPASRAIREARLCGCRGSCVVLLIDWADTGVLIDLRQAICWRADRPRNFDLPTVWFPEPCARRFSEGLSRILKPESRP